MMRQVNLTANNQNASGFLFLESHLRCFIVLMCLCISAQDVFGRGLFEWEKTPTIDPQIEEQVLNSPGEEPSEEKPDESRPKERPEWVTVTPQDPDMLYVIGKSVRIDSERAARSNARENGRIQMTQCITDQQAVSVKSLKAKAYYTEIYLDERNYKQYVVYALMAIDRKELDNLRGAQ